MSTLSSVVCDIVVVSSDSLELPPLDARVVRDREPGKGPLAGIREGLHAVRPGLAFVAGTDAPYLTPRFVEELLSFGGAAALELDGHVQTLCAVYDTAGAGVADELIAQQRMRPLFLLEASDYRLVSPDEIVDAESVRGFNRPEEYLAALRAEGAFGRATLELRGEARRRAGRSRIEVAVGTLGDVLKQAEPQLVVCREDGIAEAYRVYLNERDVVRDPGIPIGPGDHVVVMDAAD